MLGAEFMDEIDCGSFFDQMDDLIEFPADTTTDCGVIGSGGKPDDFPSIWSNTTSAFPCSDPIFSGNSSNAASDLSAELSVPYEDIVQLEWLSNFVEDSFSGGGMTMNNKENVPIKVAAAAVAVTTQNQFQTSSPVSVLESSSTTTSSSCNSTSWAGKKLPLIPAPRGPQKAARSKRSRPRTFTPRPSIRLISPASSFMETPQAFPAPVASSDSENVVESEPLKKVGPATEPKKKKIRFSMPSVASGEMNQNSAPLAVRKCMHCEITKTPQWRAGPMGPKTLCNACGVRYKSGRLFPEYRPAASPTFIPALHSNSHKKVIEMRTKGGDDNNFLGGTMSDNLEEANEPELIPNSNPSLEYI